MSRTKVYDGDPEEPHVSIPNSTIAGIDDLIVLGLLSKLRLHVGDYMPTIERLSKQVKQSRAALEAAQRNLVQRGLVIKVKYQDDRAHWATDVYVFRRPATREQVAKTLLTYPKSARVEPVHLDPRQVMPEPPDDEE